nr:hypothetical protein BaRGS_007680 [Batillaria attramentaria]
MPEDLAEFTWQCIQEEKCITATLPPVIILQLARKMQQQQEQQQEQQDQQQQESEEKGVTKGSSTSGIWKLDLAILFGCPITRAMLQAAKTISKSALVMYGGTDVGFVSAVYNADPESFVDHDAGIPEPGADVKIVDKDDENTVLPVGQLGHILVKQARSMKEYLNDPEATAAAYTPDGYFRTGDIGCFEDRGHLIVHGRGSDAIMRGAYIFYPGWLEARIRACPGVLDVAVVGVPDPSVNEELCACVVLEWG